MKVIMSEAYSYELVEDGGKLYINVMCGGSALFEVRIPLSKNKGMELVNDKTKLNDFLTMVRNNPKDYIR
ncbi:hypothetical protein [Metakosakonia massiliensis]|uniref:Uncharacterized protein n=1 Tax=Phytobacter massiliensis TaxID=1485952 RepID=A0A6N3H676_9ENTR